MEYTMKLIFSEKTDMAEMENHVRNICQRAGSIILENKDNTITYGADIYEEFGPAFMLLSFDEVVKNHVIDAIWTDPDEGSHSCKKTIIKENRGLKNTGMTK